MHQLARLLVEGVLAVFGVSVAFMVAASPATPPRAARLGPVLRFLGRWTYWWAAPLVGWLDRAGVSANQVSGLGVLLTVAAAVLAGQGWWGLAGLALMVGGLCDVLDGELARSQGAAGASGAFLDSTLDRLSELALFGGIAAGLPTRFGTYCAYAAMAASVLVSYARARGEGLGVACPPGGMERPQRLFVLVVAMLACTFLPEPWAAPFVLGACALVAVGAAATAVHRMTTIWGQLRQREAPVARPKAVRTPAATPVVRSSVR